MHSRISLFVVFVGLLFSLSCASNEDINQETKSEKRLSSEEIKNNQRYLQAAVEQAKANLENPDCNYLGEKFIDISEFKYAFTLPRFIRASVSVTEERSSTGGYDTHYKAISLDTIGEQDACSSEVKDVRCASLGYSTQNERLEKISCACLGRQGRKNYYHWRDCKITPLF